MWQGNEWKTGDRSLSISCGIATSLFVSTIPHINERNGTHCCYNKHRLLSLYLIPGECVVIHLLTVTALHCCVLLTVSLHVSVQLVVLKLLTVTYSVLWNDQRTRFSGSDCGSLVWVVPSHCTPIKLAWLCGGEWFVLEPTNWMGKLLNCDSYDSYELLLISFVQFCNSTLLLSWFHFHLFAHCCTWWHYTLCLKHCTVRLPSRKWIRLKSSAWVRYIEMFNFFFHTSVYDPIYMCLFQFTFHFPKILIRAFCCSLCGMLWTVTDTQYGLVCA